MNNNNNITPALDVDAILDKKWHLATNTHEVALSELEFALFRISEAFERWQSDCLACCVDGNFSGTDNALLHMIRMHDRAKSISDLARLLNRDDLSNLQYSLRKMAKADLIEKAKGDSKKGVTYQVTPKGLEVTDAYARYRKELLLTLTGSIANFEGKLEDASQALNLMVGMYDQAACVAASHKSG